MKVELTPEQQNELWLGSIMDDYIRDCLHVGTFEAYLLLAYHVEYTHFQFADQHYVEGTAEDITWFLLNL